MQEKPELNTASAFFDFVGRTLRSAGVPPKLTLSVKQSTWQKLKAKHARIGTLRMIPLLVGAGLCRIGEVVKRIGNIGCVHTEE
jgi:hypothetical protein